MRVRSGTSQGQEGAKDQHTPTVDVAPVAKVKVPTHLTKGGKPAECQVMMNGHIQCANPSRHEVGATSTLSGQVRATGVAQGQVRWTCSTHQGPLHRGKVLSFTAKDVAYDPTLWGITPTTLVAPVATPKVAKVRATKVATPKVVPPVSDWPIVAPLPPLSGSGPKVAPLPHD